MSHHWSNHSKIQPRDYRGATMRMHLLPPDVLKQTLMVNPIADNHQGKQIL